MQSREIGELLEELTDMEDQIAQAAARIEQVERALPDGGTRERLRQVRAQLEMALNEDHVWLGGSSYTLAASIDEIRGMAWEAKVCPRCGSHARDRDQTPNGTCGNAWHQRRRVKVGGGPAPVEMELWPEHGCWYEVGHADELGALHAPAKADGSPPEWDEVGEIEVLYADA